jgi:hypothetical protein
MLNFYHVQTFLDLPILPSCLGRLSRCSAQLPSVSPASSLSLTLASLELHCSRRANAHHPLIKSMHPKAYICQRANAHYHNLDLILSNMITKIG